MITSYSKPNPCTHFSMRMKHKSFLALVFQCCFQETFALLKVINNTGFPVLHFLLYCFGFRK